MYIAIRKYEVEGEEEQFEEILYTSNSETEIRSMVDDYNLDEKWDVEICVYIIGVESAIYRRQSLNTIKMESYIQEVNERFRNGNV